MNKNEKKYEPIFKLAYSNVFMTSLFLASYGKLRPIVTIKDGRWKFYLSKKKLNELAEEGYRMALKDGTINVFEEKYEELKKEVKNLNKIDVDKVNDREFLKILNRKFELWTDFFDVYRKTEFFFFIKIENELKNYMKNRINFDELLSGDIDITSWPEDKRKLAEYVINIQYLKFEYRKLINKIILGKKSIVSRILEQLVKRTGREDATSMKFEEVKSCLEGETVNDVSDRGVYCYMTWESGEMELFSGNEAKEKIEELKSEIPETQVKGMAASRGSVKGRAKVIPLSLNPKEYLDKVKKGDILVADTTGPEMMIAIKKAKAIVTDEGGMMSHAAIVSREFNIPCVVGTKCATEVFNDGDLVEVNADKGYAKILERKK